MAPGKRRELTGELYVAGDGTFTVFDEESGTFIKAREMDRTRAEPMTREGSWLWTVVLDDTAEAEDLELDAPRWAALFEQSHQRGEPPSVHNEDVPFVVELRDDGPGVMVRR